ncbi:MAG: LPS export ABC transporter permease LptF [Desulfobacteraceae bacterium]|nr:LPS export ABC transporter permease LptF [Desulfobacteraceae bacterium]
MKLNSIINRYILKEMLPPFTLTIVFFTFIFLMAKLVEITNLIVNYRIGVGKVLLMLMYTIPYFLVYVVPMSVMMTVLLTFLRLSGDNEIIALKAGGMSITRLLPPVFMFCLMGCLLTGFMVIKGLPWGKMRFKEQALEIAASNLSIGLKQRTFNDSFKDVMLYVNKIDVKNSLLKDIFIEDQRTEGVAITIVAPRGQLFSEPDKFIFHLRLFNGTINQVDLEKEWVNSVNFDTYEMSLDVEDALSKAKDEPKDESEMSLAELWRYMKSAPGKDSEYNLILIEFHRKFSIPFACFVLGFLAVPLGIHAKTARRSFGIGVGIFFILLYYLLLSAGTVFGEAGRYPPIIGMWVPNIVMGCIGLYLFKRAQSERPVQIFLLPGVIKRYMKFET